MTDDEIYGHLFMCDSDYEGGQPEDIPTQTFPLKLLISDEDALKVLRKEAEIRSGAEYLSITKDYISKNKWSPIWANKQA